MPSYGEPTSTNPTGWLSNLFTKKNIISGLKGATQIPTGGTSGMPLGFGGDENEAESTNNAINGGIQSAFSTALDLGTIGASGMNKTQQQMAKSDTIFNGVTSAASNIPGPVGLVASGLNLVNKFGGALISTPKEVKDYVGNDRVLASSGYSGIASQAADAQSSADTYKNSGLVGKLFGRKRVKNDINESNTMQNKISGLLNFNDNVKDRAAASTDLFASNNLNTIYGGNPWNTGAIQYGKKGTKMKPIHIKKANEGKFTEYKERTGKSTSEALQSKDSHVRKMAQFAANAKKWKHEEGGILLPKKEKIDYKNIVAKVKAKQVIEQQSQVATFEQGGKINVIVNGELHAHKHDLKSLEHLEDAEITHKGVPVTMLSEGGEVTQCAEVERDELILHYDLTKKLEELYEEGSEESMIQAGIILSTELVKNTKDSKNRILKNA